MNSETGNDQTLMINERQIVRLGVGDDCGIELFHDLERVLLGKSPHFALFFLDKVLQDGELLCRPLPEFVLLLGKPPEESNHHVF